MTDREKVMQWLKTCANGCKDGCPYEYKNLVYRVECKADLMSDALDLLREQEAVKPKREVNENGQILSCGNCGAWFAVQKQKFCHECGKAVKWDDGQVSQSRR